VGFPAGLAGDQRRELEWIPNLRKQGINVKTFLSKRLVIGATGLVMLAGAAGALAATQGSSSPSAESQAYINDLANRLSVTPSALTAAIKAAGSDQIDAAVTAGRLTEAEATALKAGIQAGTSLQLFGRGFRGGGFRRGSGGGDAAAASYLGITEATLRADLLGGQSLAQIAAATSDKSIAGLKSAIIAAETTRLDAAVAAGRITSQQEQRRLTSLSTRIDALLQRSWTGGGAWRRTGSTGATGSNLYGGSQPSV
jgi:hypothetical protein